MVMCIRCGVNERTKDRRICRQCKNKHVNDRYHSTHKRTVYNHTCSVCGDYFTAWRKKITLPICNVCRNLSKTLCKNGLNPYENAKGDGYCWMHRRIAEKILKRKLNTNEVVHHMDNDPKNNSLINLIVISRSKHGSLHYFLRIQRVIIEKSMNENAENCWNTLIVPMTTAWLETAGVKVIKLWEIGQSAAEHLNNASADALHDEGSETMHGASDRSSTEDEDIVQTTTVESPASES